MWIFVGAVAIVFVILLRKGYVKQLVIGALGIGLLAFCVSLLYLKITLEIAVYMGVCSFFIWYLLLNLMYTLVKTLKSR